MLGNLSATVDLLVESISKLQETIHALVLALRVAQEKTDRQIAAMEAQTKALEEL